MTDRTLDAVQIQEAVRRPSFEMQQAALAAGYASVRDWALAQCVEEIHALKGRVEQLEDRAVRFVASDEWARWDGEKLVAPDADA